ncbi:MAG: RluA family pseudouridine synthase [Proteobacteria bacterium]|nr:RluA family pseudouridine synthase [Pseudomonadota bacterium]
MRLDLYLLQHNILPSRKKIKHLLDLGGIRVNGKRVRMASWQVSDQDRIQCCTLLVGKKDPKKYTSKDIAILYEDSNILCINKPSGLLSTASPQPHTHLLEILKDENLKICHRLDKDTTGVMILAKNPDSYNFITQAFLKRTIEKSYHAITFPYPKITNQEKEHGWTEHSYLSKGPIGTIRSSTSQKQGKLAITHFQIMATHNQQPVSLIQCKPTTGRTHQIRVHLQNKNTSCLGDPLYGHGQWHDLDKDFLSTFTDIYPRILLHARSITIPGYNHHHKKSSDALTITAPPPTIFKETCTHFSLPYNN